MWKLKCCWISKAQNLVWNLRFGKIRRGFKDWIRKSFKIGLIIAIEIISWKFRVWFRYFNKVSRKINLYCLSKLIFRGGWKKTFCLKIRKTEKIEYNIILTSVR